MLVTLKGQMVKWFIEVRGITSLLCHYVIVAQEILLVNQFLWG